MITDLLHLFVILCLDSGDLHSEILLKFLHPSERVGIADEVDGDTLSTESTRST
jgi:hypothetical protein